jgi:Flp pilus assembly protein TadG
VRRLALILARLGADRRGATAVELGLLSPAAFVVLFALLDFGRLGFVMANLDFAAQEGARYASLHGAASGAPASDAEVAARVRAQIYGVDPAAVAVTVAWTPDRNPGSAVTVTTAHDFAFVLDMLGLPTVRLGGASSMTVY